MPGLQSGHDYQLWIIDPAEKTPVSAGIVPIESGNSARFEFRPERPVTSAAKFAVSIEKTGGSTVPLGQIILVGQLSIRMVLTLEDQSHVLNSIELLHVSRSIYF